MRRVILIAIAALLLGAPAASADRFLAPSSFDFGQQPIAGTSPAKTFSFQVTCQQPMGGGACMFFDPTYPDITTTGDFTQTNTCPVRPAFMPGDTVAGTTCTINVTFSPTGTGPRTGVLYAGGRTANLSGSGPPPAIAVPQTRKCVKIKRKKKGKKRIASAALKCKKGFKQVPV